MKNKNYLRKILPMLCMVFGSVLMYAQGTISGMVTDEAGEPLIGANIIVQGTTDGTVTDFDGTYSFSTSQSFPLTLEVSFTGFSSQEIEVASPTSDLNIIMTAGVLIGEDVVISASRKREKVQEAPASISVLSARKLEGSPQVNPTRNLVNTPGVQIQQQSAGSMNIEMRASAGVFGTSVFPIKDYRSLVGPGIGTFTSGAAGLNNVDLQRIEVVRGPGSALYGPGVTSGVVHFITKNPIDFPGTTVQLYGGEGNSYGFALRHAGTTDSKKFGYKVNAAYDRGDEFKLDGSEGTVGADGSFTRQLDKFRSTIVRPAVTNSRVDQTQPGKTLITLEPDENGNVMADNFKAFSTDLTLEFRPQDDLSFTLAGGFIQSSGVFYNDLGEGLAQAKEVWTQARMQKGGLFAQVFYVDNDGGAEDRPTFLYQTGNMASVARKQLEGQVQYNFQTDFLNADWTAGADYRSAISDSKSLTYGSREDDDDYGIIGGYLQGKFGLSDKLDLVLAGRYDTFSFLDQSSFSPRAALVYKASPKHTFRASFNRASRPPSALELAIDFPVNAPVPGVFDFWHVGQKEQHNFDNNNGIEFLNQNVVAAGIAAALGIDAARLLPLAQLLPDNLPASLLGTGGLSNDMIHQFAAGTLLATMQANGIPAPLIAGMQQFLEANAITGNNGLFYGVNVFEANAPLNELIPTNKPVLNISNTLEVGYKGLFGDKLGISLDIYRITSKGFSDFTQIAPLITLQGADVSAFNALSQQIAGFLIQNGVPQESAVALAGAYGTTANLIPNFYGTGTVESNLVPQGDGILHVATGYRIYPDAELTYWGSDLGLEYFVNNNLSLFGNYSWVNENVFDGEDLGEGADSPLSFALNAPKHKFRLGLNYSSPSGFRGNLSFQHDDSFMASVGQFSGPTDEKNLVDAGIGYKFDNGLSIDLTATNLFDQKYRTFRNMPMIRRRVLGKLTYSF